MVDLDICPGDAKTVMTYDELIAGVESICAPFPECRKLRNKIISELNTRRSLDARIVKVQVSSTKDILPYNLPYWVFVPKDAVQQLEERLP